MKTGWESVYARAEKGRNTTYFEVSVILSNGLLAHRAIRVPNADLEEFPDLFGFVLTMLSDDLDKQVKGRV